MFELLALIGTLGGIAWLVGSDERKNRLVGGQGDRLRREDVDPEEFRMGMLHEREHSKDLKIREEITLDHLAKHKDYYSVLEASEKKMTPRKKR